MVMRLWCVNDRSRKDTRQASQWIHQGAPRVGKVTWRHASVFPRS